MNDDQPRSDSEHRLLSGGLLPLAAFSASIVATVALFGLVALDASREAIQGLDDEFLLAVADGRTDVLTSIARVVTVAGSIWVTLPVRAGVSAFLAVHRRWWHLAAFLASTSLAQIASTGFKALYGRPRPAGSLVATTGDSFPSGHAVTAASLAVALVVVLVPPGAGRRLAWGPLAALFAVAIALSRAYLAAHWLSDSVGGLLLGTSVAIGSAFLVQVLRERRARLTGVRGPP
jgi:membrane-associated phospholipid phosphatase